MAKRGRPPKLKPDEQTLALLAGLGQIQCTNVEASAVLHVARETFEKFIGTNENARKAWESGKEQGKISLRRLQFRLAQTNAAMAIFLGKNYLGQKDSFDTNSTVEHGVSEELAALLMQHDGNSRSLPVRSNGVLLEHDPEPVVSPSSEHETP